ncbi:hypothetical protein Tco_0899632, partial [Tanacetum coccineum]
MLTKPQFFYDNTTKQALGFQNPFYLQKAQQSKPKLYVGDIIVQTNPIVIPDSEETLTLAEESRSKMLLKHKDNMMLEKEKQNFVNSSEPTLSIRPTNVEVPKELPKVSMVNTSLKKLKHHLANFDVVVKERTTPTAITEVQEKDTAIKRLKERIKSLSGKIDKDKIKQDFKEIETINIELDHRHDVPKRGSTSKSNLTTKEFQEIGSMASFKVLETQFQMFINSQIYLNDEYIVMTRNYFLEYTRLDIPEFRDTLIQNMDYVKKSIEKRALHKMEYDSRVNERLMQTTEDKVDSSKALDASLVDTESSGTTLKEQDTSSRSGNDSHADDADIRPISDEEPMAEVQTTDEINVFAIGQQHTEQPKHNNEGEVDQNVEQCHDTCPLPATLTDNQTTEFSNQSLESKNIRLKKIVAQFQKDFFRMEAHCVNIELKYQNQALKEGQH